MKDLLGSEVGIPEKQGKRPENYSAVVAHQKLIQLHGKTEGKKCKDCDFCFSYTFAKTYYKCSLFSTSGSPSSDWRVRWDACGRFKQEKTK